MKNKRIIVMVIVMAMLIGCMMPAGRIKVSAKNKTVRSTTLYVGQKQQWWMTLNFKKVSNKKVKWKSSKKKVAAVSKKGVVKAKKKGKVKITATYKNHTLILKVTVKNAAVSKSSGASGLTAVITPPAADSNTSTLTTSQLAANLAINTQPIATGYVLFTVTNNNAQMVSNYIINYQLKNTSGVIVDTGSVGGYVLQPGQTQYCYTYIGKDDVVGIDINQSACSVKVNSYNYTDENSNVSVTYQNTSDNDISFTYYNSGVKNVSIRSVILFYDAAGQLMKVDSDSAYLSSGETKFSTVSAPYEYDDDLNHIPTYASYKVFYYAYSS